MNTYPIEELFMISKKQEVIDKFIAKGKWRYVFLYGAFFWGFSTAFLFQGIIILFGGTTLANFVISMVVFPIAGVFWGLFMWRKLNSQGRSIGNK